MKKDIIRIFIDNDNIISISKYASLYSLKCKIKDKLYKSIEYDRILFYYNKKKLTNDSISILKYNIVNNSHIFTSLKTNGGMTGSFISILLFVFFYIIFIITFFVFLASGTLPVFANIYSYILDISIGKLKTYFNFKKINVYIYYALKIILWFIRTFILILFVWATTAIVVFPLVPVTPIIFNFSDGLL